MEGERRERGGREERNWNEIVNLQWCFLLPIQKVILHLMHMGAAWSGTQSVGGPAPAWNTGAGSFRLAGKFLLVLFVRFKGNGNSYLSVDLLLVDVLPRRREIGRWAAAFIIVSLSAYHGNGSLSTTNTFLHSSRAQHININN